MNHTQKMFSIRDSKAEIFHPPFFRNTHGEAERHIHTLAKEEKHPVNLYPEDFDLFFLGDYDTKTGKLTPQDSPQHILKAVALK